MPPDDRPTIFALSTALAGFLTYHFLAQSHGLRHWIRKRSARGRLSPNRIFAQRLLGILFSWAAAFWRYLAISDPRPGPDRAGRRGFVPIAPRATALLSVVIVLITFFNARKESNLDMYPQIRVKEWSWRLVFWSSLDLGRFTSWRMNFCSGAYCFSWCFMPKVLQLQRQLTWRQFAGSPPERRKRNPWGNSFGIRPLLVYLCHRFHLAGGHGPRGYGLKQRMVVDLLSS